MPFFRSKRANKSEAESLPTLPREEVVASPSFEIRVVIKTDVGCVRDLNEDSAHWSKPDSETQLAQRGVLVVVCDGMGGHAGGEIASKLAVETIESHYYSASSPVTNALKESLEAANSAIFNKAKRETQLRGMGTTGTALVLRGDQAYCAHVGDSRLYLVRSGGIYQMSEDHSAVMELVRRGLLRAEEARNHPQKNVVLRAVGTQPKVEVSVWDEPFPIRKGDRWLLCSDGLSDLVEDSELCDTITNNAIDVAGDLLIALARQRGGHDNITAAIVEVLPLQTLGSETEAMSEVVEATKPASAAVATREVDIP